MSLVKYGGAIGLFGGFNVIESFSALTPNGVPIRVVTGGTFSGEQYTGGSEIIRLYAVPPNSPYDDTICNLNPIYVDYKINSGSVITSSPCAGMASSRNTISPVGKEGCNINQSLEIRFRLGTYNTATGDHAADGYFEVRINGLIQLSVTGITLGVHNQQSYNCITSWPAGYKIGSLNYGLSGYYYNDTDTYGANSSSILNQDFGVLTDADIWYNINVLNPWRRPGNSQTPPDTNPVLRSYSGGATRVVDAGVFGTHMSYSASPSAITAVATGLYKLTGTSYLNPRIDYDEKWIDSSIGTKQTLSIPNPFAETFLVGDE